ncbi:2671_t:CDS:1, partial [Cetraspora pellucida]
NIHFIDLLKELNVRFLVEIAELRKENVEIKVKNTKLKDKNAEVLDLKRKFTEIEFKKVELKTRIVKFLGQVIEENKWYDVENIKFKNQNRGVEI